MRVLESVLLGAHGVDPALEGSEVLQVFLVLIEVGFGFFVGLEFFGKGVGLGLGGISPTHLEISQAFKSLPLLRKLLSMNQLFFMFLGTIAALRPRLPQLGHMGTGCHPGIKCGFYIYQCRIMVLHKVHDLFLTPKAPSVTLKHC